MVDLTSTGQLNELVINRLQRVGRDPDSYTFTRINNTNCTNYTGVNMSDAAEYWAGSSTTATRTTTTTSRTTFTTQTLWKQTNKNRIMEMKWAERTSTWDDWKDFTKSLVEDDEIKGWENLTSAEQSSVASVLHLSPEIPGRTWAFIQRTKMYDSALAEVPNVGISWDDLTDTEQVGKRFVYLWGDFVLEPLCH